MRTYSRLLLADRAQKHFFNNGILTPDRVTDDLQELAMEIQTSIIAETARWGASRNYTPATWQDHLNIVRTQIVPQRTAVVVQQMRAAGVFPLIDAPIFGRHGGLVPSGFELTIGAPSGTIYYTLDGSDPRRTDGGIHGTAYANSVELSESTIVKARAFDGTEWSALNEAHFLVGRPAMADNLVLTELNYHPHHPTADELAEDPALEDGDFEFIELHNRSDDLVLLTGVKLTGGIEFDFTGSLVETLAPAAHVVVAGNSEAWELRYGPGMPLAGQYTGRLSNEGERIELLAGSGESILDFSYCDSVNRGRGSWPDRADGNGSSLELIAPADVPPVAPQRNDYLADADNWRSSSEYGGSPGAAGEGPRRDVLVNEVLTHTDAPNIDTIELCNTTNRPIDVVGWYLSDSKGTYKKFRIPDTIIAAHGYVVFDEGDFNSGTPQPGTFDFALNGAHGDDVWLLEADSRDRLTRFVDHVEFPAAANGESFGRWPDGSGNLYPMIEPTLNPAGENSGPRIGPVIISEVQYNPAGVLGDDDLEFVEIYNSTAEEVDLTDWRIRKGIDFDFPAGTLLGPHAALIVVPFDICETVKLNDFCNAYGIGPATVQIVGGYRDVLDNGGERVQLQRGDESPLDEPDFIPRLIEDEVRYDDDPPWPIEADGTGRSLNRVATDAWGNDAASWTTASASPGTVLASGEAQVVGRYVFYDNCAGFGPTDDNAIALDKTALRPGENAAMANYTSYVLGINGVMVDIAGLPDGGALDRDDFEFRVGNSDAPNAWTEAPVPTSITVRPNAGYGGSARITLTWDDEAIKNEWLQVKVLATANTDLSSADVFYFGNAVGESGDTVGEARVNAADVLLARNNPRNFLDPAPIEFRYDFNRDRRVNAADMLIARENQTHLLNALRLISIPLENEGTAAEESPNATSSEGGIDPSPKIDWWYELPEANSQSRPAKKDSTTEEAVDTLFAIA